MNLVLLGMPGAGKGTQSKLLGEDFHIVHISTGDIFRESIKNNTALGRKAKGYMDKGELVPDNIVTEMVEERLGKEDCARGFILDGFPRTVAQAEALDGILESEGKKITAVLEFTISRDEAVRRNSARRSCRNCSAVYNLLKNPPKEDGKCDMCGHPLYQRDDDREDVILRRLDVYENQTKPLLSYYEERGLLHKIEAEASIETIGQKLHRFLKDKVIV